MSSNKPDDGCGHVNGAEKGFGQFIVTGGNGSILLEFGKEILNQMLILVPVSVILAGRLAA